MLVTNVFTSLIRESSLLAPDLPSFRRQESIFTALNLAVLSLLLAIHIFFSSFLGRPPRLLFVVLGGGLLFNVLELTWIRGVKFVSANGMVVLTWLTIVLNMLLAFLLASLSYRQDTLYFVLLVVPVLQSAFRLSFAAVMSVVAAGTVLEFYWVWNYFRLHPPAQVTEYMEAGTLSLIYTIVGILVWTLVNHLRSKDAELEQAKEDLLVEEKLAAVGRLSSSIAHEIRNPVAMISSALATAFNGGLDSRQRGEMFEIAAKEAARLEKLTSEFLVYARPQAPARHAGDVSESIAYVVEICRLRATEKAVAIRAKFDAGLRAEVDSGQVQQALINLVINAIEASLPGGVILVRATRDNGLITVDVENANGPISADATHRIFEPFFTTKPSGTGLGLAIARNVARGHGGELTLSRNQSDLVRFSIVLPACSGETGRS